MTWQSMVARRFAHMGICYSMFFTKSRICSLISRTRPADGLMQLCACCGVLSPSDPSTARLFLCSVRHLGPLERAEI